MDFRDKNRIAMFRGRRHRRLVYLVVFDGRLAVAEEKTQEIVHPAINTLLDMETGHCVGYDDFKRADEGKKKH